MPSVSTSSVNNTLLFALATLVLNSSRVGQGGSGIPKYPKKKLPTHQKINLNSFKIPKLRKPRYTLHQELVVSEVKSTRPSF